MLFIYSACYFIFYLYCPTAQIDHLRYEGKIVIVGPKMTDNKFMKTNSFSLVGEHGETSL